MFAFHKQFRRPTLTAAKFQQWYWFLVVTHVDHCHDHFENISCQFNGRYNSSAIALGPVKHCNIFLLNNISFRLLRCDSISGQSFGQSDNVKMIQILFPTINYPKLFLNIQKCPLSSVQRTPQSFAQFTLSSFILKWHFCVNSCCQKAKFIGSSEIL